MAEGLLVVKYAGRMYIWDEVKKQIRNIEDPSDTIYFQDLELNKLEEL